MSNECLWSVWNHNKSNWATSTNYSTQAESLALIDTIKRQIKDARYEVRGRPFGTISDGQSR